MIDQAISYLNILGPRGLAIGVLGKATKNQSLFKLQRADIQFPFSVRVPSSDVSTYKQVFVEKEYDFEVVKQPKVIVDAGANIGLASIYFAGIFPDARIIAIEPEESNFELLKKNVSPYRNITAINAAVWNENKRISLVDPGLGKWGFMTQERGEEREVLGSSCHDVEAITIEKLMKEFQIDHIDILKVDIEGAEREVFADSSAWIGKVDVLIIELHEHLKSGCNRSFYRGTMGFDNEWKRGENVYLTRSGSCLTRK